MEATYRYKAKLKRVVDGDTIIFNIDLGFRVWTEVTVRLADIDTPETHRPRNDAERAHGWEAKRFVIEALTESPAIVIESSKTGKYGRWIADVEYHEIGIGFRNLTEELYGAGLAKLEEYPDVPAEQYPAWLPKP